MNKEKISLVPYLFFEGNCEEALTYYAEIFNGTITLVQRYDNPAMNAPASYRNKILHAAFQFGENMILASDVAPGETLNRGNYEVAMSITLVDVNECNIIFEKLADGGTVNVPFEKQFWGAWHGNLKDRFGISWMVNSES